MPLPVDEAMGMGMGLEPDVLPVQRNEPSGLTVT